MKSLETILIESMRDEKIKEVELARRAQGLLYTGFTQKQVNEILQEFYKSKGI